MDLFMNIKCANHVSALLTLTKIGNSQDEMLYITKMRNLILFQIPCEDYQYFKYKFQHRITFDQRKGSLLFRCLNQTFSVVAKSHVPVHNVESLRHWRSTTVDNDSLLLSPNLDRNDARKENINDENMPRDQVLITTVTDLFGEIFWGYKNGRNQRYVAKIPLGVYESHSKNDLNPMHESTWRRLYDANKTLFTCGLDDVVQYIKELKQKLRPVNVFKGIMKREIGSAFKEPRVLRTIASPYYYFLPHQDEREYAKFETNRASFYGTKCSNFMEFQFLSRLQIAVKNVS